MECAFTLISQVVSARKVLLHCAIKPGTEVNVQHHKKARDRLLDHTPGGFREVKYETTVVHLRIV